MTKAKVGSLTREAVLMAMRPPNNCRVKRLLDQMDDEQRQVSEEALGYDGKDLPSGTLRQLWIDAGYDENVVPGVDAITDHRRGRRPCRCKG
jgi:hypothetical protein